MKDLKMAVERHCQMKTPKYSLRTSAVQYLGPIWEKNRCIKLQDPEQTLEHLNLTGEFIHRFEISRKTKVDVTVQVVGEEKLHHFTLGKKDLVKAVERCLAREVPDVNNFELQHEGKVLSLDVILGTLVGEKDPLLIAYPQDEPPPLSSMRKAVFLTMTQMVAPASNWTTVLVTFLMNKRLLGRLTPHIIPFDIPFCTLTAFCIVNAF